MARTARRAAMAVVVACATALAGCEALLDVGSLKERDSLDGAVSPGGDATVDGSGDGSNVGLGPDGSNVGPDGSNVGPDGSNVGPDGNTVGPDGGSEGGITCPAGLQCNVQCGGATTTVTGTVMDPAGRNPLYNITVFVPILPLQPLPKGVPTGSDACSCAALYKSGAVVSTQTDVDGTFTLSNVPVGKSVPIVIQAGKWRRQITMNVTACSPNTVPGGTILMPSSVPKGDTNDNIPDIAVSTGAADTLECLLRRVGLPATEYVPGNPDAGPTGHVHIFAGGTTSFNAGSPETPPMPGAPASPTSLWVDSQHLMPYDLVLLSCEGGETYAANPQGLEQYLNAGGRVFASHFHYVWFAGPLVSTQPYTAPPDWGSNLASWSGSVPFNDTAPAGGTVVTALNGSSATFFKGQAMKQWLTLTQAFADSGVPAGELPIYQARYSAIVGSSNKHSQTWMTSPSPVTTDAGTPTYAMYLSFDTPVNSPSGNYCGRAVFSDLHVSGNPSTLDTPPPPGGCGSGKLSPQEMALEFMLFDLSTCVIPDTIAPPDGGVPGL
jgi:hypothetical protein